MEPKTLFYVLIITGVLSCNDETEQTPLPDIIESGTDTVEKKISKDSVRDYIIDSLLTLRFDLTTLEGQRANVLRDWKVDHYPKHPSSEKVYDLNHDGFDDYTIHYEQTVNDRSIICSDVYIYNAELEYYEYDKSRSE